MRRAKRPPSRCAACFPGSTVIPRGGHARGRAPWARMLPVKVSFTCCLLAPGSCLFRLRQCWMPWDRPPRAKKASPRRGPSSPPVCWHLLRPFRRSHSRHWGCLNRRRPLQQLATMRPAPPRGRALRQKQTSCSHIFLLVLRTGADDKALTPGTWGWWLSPSMLHAEFVQRCQQSLIRPRSSSVLGGGDSSGGCHAALRAIEAMWADQGADVRHTPGWQKVPGGAAWS